MEGDAVKGQAIPTVGYAYVVADLFHIGHLRHLQSCKSMCDRLIVGILTDEATMEKKRSPIIPFNERLEIISGIRCVDEAIEQNTYSPLPNVAHLTDRLTDRLGIDILFESTSHTPVAIEDAKKLMADLGGKVVVMPYYEGQSSTAIKEKVVREWK